MVQVSWVTLQASTYLRKMQCNFIRVYVPKPENTQPNLLISRVACAEKHTPFFFFFPYQS